MHRPSRQSSGGFSMVELLVSMVVLLIMAAVAFSITSATAKVWKKTNTKIDSYQSARTAFELITRNLSQATLNTYWDYYQDTNGLVLSGSSGIVNHYGRNSDLHFVCGQASSLITSNKNISGNTPAVRPCHAVFFVSLLGCATQPSTGATTPDYKGLDQTLNAVGYYIEFNDDTLDRPAFLRTGSNVLYRYRLMQVMQPTESLSIYRPGASSNAWFNDAINNGDVRAIADNVIALIIQPKRSKADTPALSPDYNYDSRTTNTSQLIMRHQLPPLVQVTMVVLDETSAIQLSQRNGQNAPALIATNAFTSASGVTDSDNPELDQLLQTLNSQRLAYRVFSTNVLIRGAKWSEN